MPAWRDIAQRAAQLRRHAEAVQKEAPSSRAHLRAAIDLNMAAQGLEEAAKRLKEALPEQPPPPPPPWDDVEARAKSDPTLRTLLESSGPPPVITGTRRSPSNREQRS